MSIESLKVWIGNKISKIKIDNLKKQSIIEENLILNEMKLGKRNNTISNLKIIGSLPNNFIDKKIRGQYEEVFINFNIFIY